MCKEIRDLLDDFAYETADNLTQLWETVYSMDGNVHEQSTSQRAIVRRFERKIRRLEERIERLESRQDLK